MNENPDNTAHPDNNPPDPEAVAEESKTKRKRQPTPTVPEFGGPEGPEPTRYGDWEKKGRCYDF